MPLGPIDVIRVNNQPYSWTSTASSFNFIPYTGILSVSVAESLDVETVYDQNGDQRPIGATAGLYKVESFKIKMLRDSANSLTDMLVALPPFFSIGRTEFLFQLSCSEPLLLGSSPIILVADACRIIGIDETTEKGSEALVTEYTLWSKGITRNGKSLYTPSIPGIGAL
ncbi:MAG TPA: hypothetical protein VM690_07535 [Gaiellaceae bacterium]|nr:hypothetical protein [Gaiellaceae bacterium]